MARTLVAERQRARVATEQWLLPTLLALFFLSGTSALIYQVLWLRLLALVFGVTVWAASTVIASFMGGLALGSFAAGRFVDRARNPLVWFGVAEGLVGLSALATPWALHAAESVYAALYRAFPDELVALTVLRFVVSSAVLIVPTALMGASLPIIVKSALVRAERLDARVSLLYATNTTGAIVGTLLAGFYLIGGIGIAASFRLAAALNLIVALGALLAARRIADRIDQPIRTAASAAVESATPLARRLVLIAFVLSGFASLAQEVIWSRLLVFFQAINAYAFVVMLAAFLSGIAFGSYLAAPLLRRRLNWLVVLAVIEALIAIVSVLALTFLTLADRVVPSLQARLGLPGWDWLPITVVSFLALLPTTTLLGIAFPIGLRIWSANGETRRDRAGRRIGIFYALNVVGSIGGAIAAGFVLLPLFGSRTSLLAIAAVSLIGGLALLAAVENRRLAAALASTAILGFAAAVTTAPDPFTTILRYRYGGQEVLWREEGVQTTVSVHRLKDNSLAMFLDGHNQATDSGAGGVHRMIGSLPMALHPDPRDALVIGLGGGATAGAVAAFPGVNVEIVELSSSVVRGSEYFRHINNDVLYRPNVRMLVQDGRNHLLLTDKRYDVITADIIWPYHAGAGNLYSREYFQLARERLRDDGIMLQWIGMLGETQHKLVMRTFLDVFPETTIWNNGTLMVGSKRPFALTAADFERRRSDPPTRQVLDAIGFTSIEKIAEMYHAGPAELRRYVGPGAVLTDDRPMLEYFYSLPTNEPPGDIEHVRGNVKDVIAS